MQTSVATKPEIDNSEKKRNKYLVPMLIIGGLFLIFGFITWVNSTLIPFMKFVCELTDSEALLVASSFYISYCVMALPSSLVLKKVGYKKTMAIGLFIMALGALIFIPAANSRSYFVFLTGIFLQGIGLTLLQTASNPYITILGPIESAARRISIMGICNKMAGALGSVVLGSILLNNIDSVKASFQSLTEEQRLMKLNEIANDIVDPYIVIAIVLVVLGFLIRFSPLPEIEIAEDEEKGEATSKNSIFQFPHLWWGVLALFMYMGVEVIAGDTIITYGNSVGIDLKDAKYFTSYTLYSMVGAYMVGILLIPSVIKQETALKICAVIGSVLTIAIVSTSGFTSVMFVAALGVANSLMWPAIWPMALRGLGKFTKTGSALLIMAIAGGAVFPVLFGKIVDTVKSNKMLSGISEQEASGMAYSNAYWILLPCYLTILYFGVRGYKSK